MHFRQHSCPDSFPISFFLGRFLLLFILINTFGWTETIAVKSLLWLKRQNMFVSLQLRYKMPVQRRWTNWDTQLETSYQTASFPNTDRRWLLEMTVGARFSLPYTSTFLCPLSSPFFPPFPRFSPSSPVLRLFSSLPCLPPAFPPSCVVPTPLIQIGRVGNA